MTRSVSPSRSLTSVRRSGSSGSGRNVATKAGLMYTGVPVTLSWNCTIMGSLLVDGCPSGHSRSVQSARPASGSRFASSRHVRALLFDLDGTLIDTVYAHVFAWQRALAEAGSSGEPR